MTYRVYWTDVYIGRGGNEVIPSEDGNCFTLCTGNVRGLSTKRTIPYDEKMIYAAGSFGLPLPLSKHFAPLDELVSHIESVTKVFLENLNAQSAAELKTMEEDNAD